jgi:hypothetical protein
VTSTTVAGIGPAAVSFLLGRPSPAASGNEPSGAPVTAERRADHAPGDAPADDANDFSPLAPPLRDLGVGTRKTLVGIIPPSVAQPMATVASPPAAAAASVPAATASPPPAAAPAAASTQSLVIAGTPCRSIDFPSDDEAIDSVVPLRRLGNATVPFPRPRAAARSARAEEVHSDEMLPDAYRQQAPQSWRNRTHNTLRVVLTDPDHRPHLVAGLLVCSAAALVIFALGRSPVSGTGMLGQTTGSLSGPSAAPAARPGASPPPAAAEEASGKSPLGAGTPAAAASTGVEVVEQAEPAEPRRDGPALEGEEVAPGLVVPPRATPPSAAPASSAGSSAATPLVTPPRAPPKPEPARVAPPVQPGALGGASPAAAPRAAPPAALAPKPALPVPKPPTATGAVPAATPPRAVPPRKPGTEGAPPRPANPDFDFGI